tara:strand:+ start:16683 stop:16922 length:240 start_codon:yes stop_codon:yes gene_type:complete
MDITGRIIYPTAPAEGESYSGVAVVVPAPQAVERGETHEEFMARIAAKDVPAGVPFQIISTGDLPADRYFRNAWEYSES